MKKQTLTICVVLIVCLFGCKRAISDLPKKEFKYLLLTKGDGIKDLCYVNKDIFRGVRNLGKLDSYWIDEEGNPPHSTFEYKEYGLVIDGFPEGCYEFKNRGKLFFLCDPATLYRISVDLGMSTIKKIRLYDDKELIYPLTVERVAKLYGKPDKTERKETFFRLIYHFNESSVSFTGKKEGIIDNISIFRTACELYL